MQKEHIPLPHFELPRNIGYFHPRQEMRERVAMDDPALECMTDLRQVTAVTIEPSVPIDQALQKMIERRVRLLLVISPQQEVIGLITARDIQGEKPQKFQTEVSVRYEEILVRDIMTPQQRLETLRMEDVFKASVGDIVATLKRMGRQHALVMDRDPVSDAPALRGIFSATQISKQLGMPVETTGAAVSFAELGAALGG